MKLSRDPAGSGAAGKPLWLGRGNRVIPAVPISPDGKEWLCSFPLQLMAISRAACPAQGGCTVPCRAVLCGEQEAEPGAALQTPATGGQGLIPTEGG